jgi:hypothetical protein
MEGVMAKKKPVDRHKLMRVLMELNQKRILTVW